MPVRPIEVADTACSFIYVLEETLPRVCLEISPNSLLRSHLKIGSALTNKFLVIKLVSDNMMFIF